MGSYYMGFHYDMPKRGEGYCLEWPNGCISCITKTSANKVRRELIDMGVDKNEISIEKN